MGHNFSQTETLSEYIENDDLVSAAKLILKGANPNQLNSSGKSCLRIALEQGNSQLFRTFHQIGGKIIPPLLTENPLHYSVRHSHNKLVRLFLRNSQAFPNYKNSKNTEGRTPLHLAAYLGNAELVAILLKYNCEKGILDNLGKTPRDLAIESKALHIEEILELLGSEELIVNSPNPGKDMLKSPHSRRISSKSTYFSSITEMDNKADNLENALKDSRVPVISHDEITFGDIISRGSSCVVYRGY